MKYLCQSKDNVLILWVDDNQNIYWFIYTSIASHGDYKSHTGVCTSIGKGMFCSFSNKQKSNAQSSIEAKLNGIDYKISKVVCVKCFLKCQGFVINNTVIFQDNQSAMKLENNGTESTGKRTYHFNIKLFYVKDLMKQGVMKIDYCHSDSMIADYLSKPLNSVKFNEFKKRIMNLK